MAPEKEEFMLTSFLNKLKGQPEQEPQLFLAVQIDDEFVKTAIWTVKDQATSLVAVGSTQDINRLAGPNTRRIDLRGRAVTPGFIDNHAHYQEEGAYWTLENRLDGVESRKQAADIIRARAKARGPGAWIYTLGGWSPDQFADDSRPFTRQELDTVAPENPVFLQLSVSLAEAEATVASAKARVAEYDRRVRELKAAANAIPQIEAEYTQLTRNYEVTKKNYELLLSRLESAQISGDMESKSRVMDFRVVDPPQVPSVPTWPNRPLLMSIVLLVALAAGAGFAFVMSQIRPTFTSERRLKEISGLPVFGTIVMAWTPGQLAKRKKGLMALLLTFLSLLSAYAAIMASILLTVARA